MGSFGEHLRREREMRGIGLEEIATATKISARNLRALEDEKFNQLPGGIFNKGFVRAYAKFLGIDQEQMVAEYESASQETEAEREQKLKDTFSKAEFRKQKDDSQEISLEPKSQWGTIAVIVLIAALAYGGYNFYQRRKLDKLQQAQTPPVVVHTPAVTPPSPAAVTPIPATNVATTNAQALPASTNPQTGNPQAGTPQTGLTPTVTNPTKPAPTKTDSTKPEPPKSEPPKPASQKTETAVPSATPTSASANKPQSAAGPLFELKIKVNKQSWISIKADGKTIVNTTLDPGTERSFKAADKIEMILGNAGGVEVSYNGKPVENLNTGQDVRKLTFTPFGYE